MFKFLCALLICLTFSSAHAGYIIASYNTAHLDTNAPTRVMLAGSGDDLKLLFQEVATAKAMKYAENNPSEQILFITANEKEMDNEIQLKRWGFTVVKTDNSTLDGKEFIKLP